MNYPVVCVLSGPEKTRAKAELALEKARLTIIPPTEWPISRRSYQAEDWPSISPYPLVRLPEKKGKPERNEYAPAPFVNTDDQWGHVAVLAETEALFHASYACVEKAGWVLRQHYELPPMPEPDPMVKLAATIQEMKAEIAALKAGRG